MQTNQKLSPVAGVPAWKRLIAGGAERKTRLHDELGRPVPLVRAIRNAPRALASGAMRIFFGKRPERPWISYDAQAVLAAHLNGRSNVCEFGSGMSTIWYGRRAGHVVSIEDNRDWHLLIGDRLRALGNVEYHFAADREAYVALAPDRPYDLVMIDGHWRDACAHFAVDHLREGGIVYLDNSDKGDNPETTGDIPAARRLLLDFARSKGLRVREFTDFAPTQLFVQRGLMVGG